MKTILLAAALALLALPAHAETTYTASQDSAELKAPIIIEGTRTLPPESNDCGASTAAQARKALNVPTVDVDVPEEKKPSALKKAIQTTKKACRKTYHGCRWFCHKTKPFVDYGGSAANFALLFIGKS